MKRNTNAEAMIRRKFEAMSAVLTDERARRVWAATESRALGYGGDSVVARATGVSRTTIRKARAGLDAGLELTGRIRKPGGGRPRLTQLQPGLEEALDRLVDPVTRGDPESPLRWTTKSCDRLCQALVKLGFDASPSTIRRLLRAQGYRMQSTRKVLERRHHDDRDAQFAYINGAVGDYFKAGNPVVSVDTKKKELVGDFGNAGKEWQPTGDPEKVLSHDFRSDAFGKAIPYGVYDIHRNEAMVNVGIDHDTPAFAVESIRQWWITMGRPFYPHSDRLLINADGGGSNGYRIRAWKAQLQEFANETGLTIDVSHFPPGTSKWNKIEHRLFSFITVNWRGRPLTTYQTVVELIGATTTAKGLRVKAVLDENEYPIGVKISDAEMQQLNITRSDWHGEWNYTIAPVPS
jgi:hypothetical protein